MHSASWFSHGTSPYPIGSVVLRGDELIMSSKITIAALQGGTNPGQIASLSNIGTTETAFTMVPNPIVGGVTAAMISLPDPSLFDNGAMFKVKIAGVVTTAVSTTVAVKLYVGNDTNLSN